MYPCNVLQTHAKNLISCPSARWKSDSLTVIETPPGIDSNMIVKHAYAKYDLSIGIGLSQVNGKVRVYRLGFFVDSSNLIL